MPVTIPGAVFRMPALDWAGRPPPPVLVSLRVPHETPVHRPGRPRRRRSRLRPGLRPAAAPPADTWPRAIAVENGSVEIFQPQIESFQGDQLAARAAVAWTPKGRPPAFGVVWVEARVSIDKVAGDVALQDVKVQRVRFANMSKEQEQQGRALLEREIPTWNLHLSVLELEASIAVNEKEIQSSEALDFTPPRMVFSQEPAVLLVFDGAPIERPVESTELRRVVNTPMLVLFDPATRTLLPVGREVLVRGPRRDGSVRPGGRAVTGGGRLLRPESPAAHRAGGRTRRSRRPRRPCSSPTSPPGSWWPPSPPSSSCSTALRSTGRWGTKPTSSTWPTPRATCSSTCSRVRPTCWPPGGGSGPRPSTDPG